ncbi:hypothetical protein AN476_21735, partial [Phaeobacter sp. 11ANDIMAR09]
YFRAKLAALQAGFLKYLKKMVFAEVIKSPSVQHLEFKGQSMIVSVFETLQSDPKRLLPTDTFAKYEADSDGLRVICVLSDIPKDEGGDPLRDWAISVLKGRENHRFLPKMPLHSFGFVHCQKSQARLWTQRCNYVQAAFRFLCILAPRKLNFT